MKSYGVPTPAESGAFATYLISGWVEVLARPDVQLSVGYDADEPTAIIDDTKLGRTTRWPLNPT